MIGHLALGSVAGAMLAIEAAGASRNPALDRVYRPREQHDAHVQDWYDYLSFLAEKARRDAARQARLVRDEAIMSAAEAKRQRKRERNLRFAGRTSPLPDASVRGRGE
jgi:membrane-bound ClpP family serine protease